MDNKLEQELKELKDVRRKRAEIMRRLKKAGYTYLRIGEVYGSNRQYVRNEIKWLEEEEEES